MNTLESIGVIALCLLGVGFLYFTIVGALIVIFGEVS